MENSIFRKKSSNNKGFAAIEAILAATLFSLVIATFVGALIYSQQNSLVVGDSCRAIFLAEEGLEVARNLNDEDFSNLTVGNHGLDIHDGAWHFQDQADNTDIFHREIEISSVDENTKQVVSTVSWNGLFQEPHSVSFESYFTNRSPASP